MEKDQLISMIHFLVKREDERAQENQELKDMVKELRDTHKQDVKTQASLLTTISYTSRMLIFSPKELRLSRVFTSLLTSRYPISYSCMIWKNSIG